MSKTLERPTKEFIGFRCPTPLSTMLKASAHGEQRTVSNLIVLLLSKQLQHGRK